MSNDSKQITVRGTSTYTEIECIGCRALMEERATLHDLAKRQAFFIENQSNQHDALKQELAAAKRERDLAIAHDIQPYPTAEAYENVCKALCMVRDERDALKAELAAAKEENKDLNGLYYIERNLVRTLLDDAKKLTSEHEDLKASLEAVAKERDLQCTEKQRCIGMLEVLREELAAAGEIITELINGECLDLKAVDGARKFLAGF